MPRMTRAALKAQAQADEYPESLQEATKEKECDLQGTSSTLVHEDQAEVELGDAPETDTHNTHDLAVRQALRDITDENYPKADLNVEVQSLSPVKDSVQEEQQDLQKSTRKSRGKAKGRSKKKTNAPVAVDTEEEEEQTSQTTVTDQRSPRKNLHSTSEDSTTKLLETERAEEEIIEQPFSAEQLVVDGEETSGPGPAIVEDLQEDNRVDNQPSNILKFNPVVHSPEPEEVQTQEDSFVKSIISRSPSKHSLSQQDQSEASQSFTDSLQTFTPLRRTSSSRFEESFEAMDSLEDTIEQMTAGLPLMSSENMHSPDSPVKANRRSVRIETTPATPKSRTSKTPRSTSSKLQSMLKSQDKENTPPVPKTPLNSKTSLKAKTPVTKGATPLKSRTPAARQSSPLKEGSLSVRKSRTPARSALTDSTAKKPISATAPTTSTLSPTKTSRHPSTMPDLANKMQPMTKKTTSSLQRKPSQRQPSAAVVSKKLENPIRKPTGAIKEEAKKEHQTSMSFSASPAKEPTNAHKRRVTSGSILSTSKPAFTIAKSTKLPTTSTFALPGEAVAEKLKAQKEAREEHKKQPKVSIAEQKAAKLKADREAREERVRQNQIKAKEEAEEKENRKPQRPVSMSALTISKARAEAAERGRQASKEWAEKMLKKKGPTVAEVKVTPVETA